MASSADTTVVVVNPGWGDEVQAAKAGLMEIADVFVINKADRPAPPTRGATSSRCWRSPGATAGTSHRGDRRHRRSRRGRAVVRARRPRAPPGVDRPARAPAAERLERELAAIVAERLHDRAVALCTGEERERLQGEVLARRLDPGRRPTASSPAPDRGVLPIRSGVRSPGQRAASTPDRVARVTAAAVGSPTMAEALVRVERRDDGVAVVTLDHPG